MRRELTALVLLDLQHMEVTGPISFRLDLKIIQLGIGADQCLGDGIREVILSRRTIKIFNDAGLAVLAANDEHPAMPNAGMRDVPHGGIEVEVNRRLMDNPWRDIDEESIAQKRRVQATSA